MKLLAGGLLLAASLYGQIGTNGAGGGGTATVTITGDCTYSSPTIICTKTNGVAFGTMATQNANNVAIIGGFVGNGQSPVNIVYTNTLSSVSGITNYIGSITNFGSDISLDTNGTATAAVNYKSGSTAWTSSVWNGSNSGLNDQWTMGPLVPNGTNATTTLAIQHSGPGGGIVQVVAPLTANSLSTNQASATGTTCTVGGYITLTIDGTSRKVATCQ